MGKEQQRVNNQHDAIMRIRLAKLQATGARVTFCPKWRLDCKTYVQVLDVSYNFQIGVNDSYQNALQFAGLSGKIKQLKDLGAKVNFCANTDKKDEVYVKIVDENGDKIKGEVFLLYTEFQKALDFLKE